MKNGQLDEDWELKIVGLVIEDRMIGDLIKDIIKYFWIDMKLLAKHVKVVFLMVNQHMQLRCLRRRLVKLVKYTGPLNLIMKSSNNVLEPVIMYSNII
jgi:hypothetical protein